MKTAPECCQKLPIDRVQCLAPEVFHERFLVGHGKPVIITDALKSWAAPSLWSFDLFRNRYGSDNISPSTYAGKICMKLMKLRDFLDYLDSPDGPAPGFWIDSATKHPCPGPVEKPATPFYLAWNVFRRHPELLEEIELSPRFVEDWLPLLPAALRKMMDEATRYFSAGLMIGPKDAQIGLHFDFLDTHAYLAQVVGRKRCVLFSPEDSQALYEGKVQLDAVDLENFPLFRQATAFECILEPGELLFMPHRWWHHIVALEKSITVNYNFFNRVNFPGYLTRLLQALPALVSGLEQSPDARAALGIRWRSQGFAFPNS